MVRKFPPFRSERKKRSTSEGTPQFPNGISGKLPYHLNSNRNFRIFWPNGKHPPTHVISRYGLDAPAWMRSVSFLGKFTSASRISASRSDLLKLPIAGQYCRPGAFPDSKKRLLFEWKLKYSGNIQRSRLPKVTLI